MSAAGDASILVVDDEPDLRTLYELTLLREGYRVDAVENLQLAWQHLNAGRYAVLIVDMRLPDGLGTELIQSLRAQQRAERCVVITAYGSAQNAVEALKAGAFDYLSKPVDLKQLRAVIASAVQDALAAGQNAATPSMKAALAGGVSAAPAAASSASAWPKSDALRQLVGQSAAMRQVRERILKVARSMAPVLISGESGTGKELTAQALHSCSHRSAGPLVAVNCAAIPENLLEAEFFGVRKGAYTGAIQHRDGYFQAARGGTLFLDEIGDLALSMQSKLLRAIQERRVRPVGGTQEEVVDVRIVSATHKSLAQEVRRGRFRQDLFYRLNVIAITLPPLRERREDLPALCETLLARIAKESGLPYSPQLAPAVLSKLLCLPLPGNVRELENLLHRALALGEGQELSLEGLDTAPAALEPALPEVAPEVLFETAFEIAPSSPPQTLPRGADAAAAPSAQGVAPEAALTPLTARVPASANLGAAEPTTELPADLQSHLDRQEREILVRALQESGFNRTAAAARLGLSLRQIRYRIARLQIDIPQGSEPDA